MADLEPAVIESLLHEGARRRGETVDAYRDFIQTTAGRAGVSFEKALQLANYFETLPPAERRAMVEQLLILKEEAARYGVSVDRFAEIMLDDDARGVSPCPVVAGRVRSCLDRA